MIFTVTSTGFIDLEGIREPCALGRGGVRPGPEKREGDGATPAGDWPLRRALWRPDRGAAPETALPVDPIMPSDGWCDDPADPLYNRPVKLPYRASAESLWRDDGVYDRVIVLGHNDDPVEPGLGSAIFIHLAREDGSPTEGCVALSAPALDRLLKLAGAGDVLRILA